jgi:hypothetical protein
MANKQIGGTAIHSTAVACGLNDNHASSLPYTHVASDNKQSIRVSACLIASQSSINSWRNNQTIKTNQTVVNATQSRKSARRAIMRQFSFCMARARLTQAPLLRS